MGKGVSTEASRRPETMPMLRTRQGMERTTPGVDLCDWAIRYVVNLPSCIRFTASGARRSELTVLVPHCCSGCVEKAPCSGLPRPLVEQSVVLCISSSRPILSIPCILEHPSNETVLPTHRPHSTSRPFLLVPPCYCHRQLDPRPVKIHCLPSFSFLPLSFYEPSLWRHNTPRSEL